MGFNIDLFKKLQDELSAKNVTLIAVSKTQSLDNIMAAYDAGQRDFGENYVQELADKYTALPKDIRWHFIGHLQSNKVKVILPFVHLIHGVDSQKLLLEIGKQAVKINRDINCLLQIHISGEETKFGLNKEELEKLISGIGPNDGKTSRTCIRGLMGMASFTKDETVVKNEFATLRSLFNLHRNDPVFNNEFSILSMGMSADYRLAIDAGSTLVRIGSLLFGSRQG